MDENTAWENFVRTGSVSDYLNYCRIRLGVASDVRDVRAPSKEPDVSEKPPLYAPGHGTDRFGNDSDERGRTLF